MNVGLHFHCAVDVHERSGSNYNSNFLSSEVGSKCFICPLNVLYIKLSYEIFEMYFTILSLKKYAC